MNWEILMFAGVFMTFVGAAGLYITHPQKIARPVNPARHKEV